MTVSSALRNARVRLDALRAARADREGIRARQRRRLTDLLAFVTRQSRFYARHYADVERPITSLDALPPVRKPALMANLDDVVTDTAVTRERVDAHLADPDAVGRRLLGRYPVWTTSGTTGDPGVFLQDDRSLAAADAVSDRWWLPALRDRRALERLARRGLRTAEIAVDGGHYAGAAGIEMYRREHPLLGQRMRLLSPTRPLSDLVAELDAFRPTVLVGYASALVELARERRAGRLTLDPALVVPTAEALTDADARLLREAFDCPVRELYGATEFPAIAAECARGNLHVNADWVVLEPVDAGYRPVPPGEPSETVLLTNLANRIQPLVRYDLGDSVTLRETPCPCGSAFPVLDVAGRQGDVLRFETASGERVPVFPLALTSAVERVPGVRRSQVVRTAPDELRVRLDVASDADERDVWARVQRDVSAFLADLDIADVRVERSPDPPARDPDSAKFRHVWSEID
ncbi:MAG: phenylacetate--CoA ligase family protein [Halarchaeum sp.]